MHLFISDTPTVPSHSRVKAVFCDIFTILLSSGILMYTQITAGTICFSGGLKFKLLQKLNWSVCTPTLSFSLPYFSLSLSQGCVKEKELVKYGTTSTF